MAEKLAFETLTPKQAEALLSKNEANRTLRDAKVAQYTRDMEKGNWDLCAAPLVISAEGKLLDGQHRLHAQVKSGKTIKWVVLKGVSLDIQHTIDTGIQRSAVDVLHFMGEKYTAQLAAAARLVHQIKSNGMIGKRYESASMDEILTVINEEASLRYSVEAAMSTRNMMTPISQSILAAAHWMIAKTNGDDEATAFIRRIATLSGEAPGSPVLALSKRANEIRRQSIRVKKRDWLALIIKAWNYDATGRGVNKIALYSKTGEFVLPEVAERTSPPFVIDYDNDEDEIAVEKPPAAEKPAEAEPTKEPVAS